MDRPSHGVASLGWARVLKAGGRSSRSCPPHGPLLTEALEEDVYVIKCMKCGLWGPERDDVLQAKLAFDESFDVVSPREF